MKKLLLLFIIIVLPIAASADDSGMCGENLIWTFDSSTRTLTITGNGYMYDYFWDSECFDDCYNHIPWKNKNIEKVIIEEGVKSIGEWAFIVCSGLTSITIPSSLTSIGYDAFGGCSGLTSVIISDLDAWCRISFSSNPLSYAHHLYLNNMEITNLVIPESVTSIGEDAFLGCSGLTSVTIPNSVTSIGNCAFYGCSGLTSVVIDNGLTSIGYAAFYGCSSLTTITIPNSVTSIGAGAFWGCKSLPIENNIRYADTYLIEVVDKTLSNYQIKEGIRFIGPSAFHGCIGLTSVTIPNSVTNIGDWAFSGCSGLSSVTIGSKLKEIGRDVFNCENLTSVKMANPIPNTICVFYDDYHVDYSNGSIYYYEDDHVDYCNDFECLYDNLFTNYDGITLYVPFGSRDAYLAVDYWSGFREIVEYSDAIPFNDSTVKSLCVSNWDTNNNGELEMAEAAAVTSLGTVFKKKDITTFNELVYFTKLKFISEGAFANSKIQEITLPDNVESLEKDAFLNCKSLVTLHIPANVANIGQNALSGCTAMTSITVDDDNSTYRDIYGVLFTKDGKRLLQYPSAKTNEYIVPYRTEVIGRDAFYQAKVTKVTLPTTLKELVYDAFGYCEQLIELEIPEGLVTIGDYIFDHCSSLKTIYIPSSVTSIGKAIGQKCDSIMHVYCAINNPFAINDNSFTTTVYANATLHVPSLTKTRYDTVGGWKNFSNIQSDTVSYIVISQDGNMVTFYQDDLKDVRSGIVLGIDDYKGLDANKAAKVIKVVFNPPFSDYRPKSTCSWFCGMINLTNIEGMEYLNTSEVTSMQAMFSGCSSLTSLDVSHFDTSNVMNMGSMFSGCSKLTILDVSHFATSNVWDMSELFSGCSSLTNLDVSHFDTSNVTDMEKMFYGCSSLTNLDVSHFDTSNVHPEVEICIYIVDEEKPRIFYLSYSFYHGSMRSMFSGCRSLTSLDVSHFNTFNVYDMRGMFEGCHSLVSLDLSRLYVGNAFGEREVLTNYMCNENLLNDFDSMELFYVEDVDEFFYENDFDDYINLESGLYGTAGLLSDCKGLQNLKLSSSMSGLYEGEYCSFVNYEEDYFLNSCNGVGKESSPCLLFVPSDFNFGSSVDTSGTFQWKGGWFTLEDSDNKSYFALSEDGKTVTFYYDNQKEERPGMIFDLEGYKGLGADTAAVVTKVVFDPSFVQARPTSTRQWFYKMDKLSTIEGMENLNTSEVTSMQAMFSQCSSLESLDLSHFDTSKVTSTRNMFNGCSSLASLDVGSFNTSNVTTMYGMFYNCSGLASLDLSHFNTSNVTTMQSMFNGCASLASLDLSNFDTSNVTTMAGMFNGCSKLASVDVGSFITSEVTTMEYMFVRCSSLTSLDVSNFDMSNVTSTTSMFGSCNGLTHLAISSTMGNLNDKACNGVGTEESPCIISAPEGFDFGDVNIYGTFQWKAGWFTLGIYSSCTLTAKAVSIAPGGGSALVLSLDNGDEKVSAFQFDLTLPEGVTLAEDGNGFACTLASRCNGMSVRVVEKQEHCYSLMAFFLDYNKAIEGTSGPVVTLALQAEEGLSEGDLEGVVDNIVLTNLDYDVLKVAPVTFPITISQYPSGDVNHDGDVNVADVMMTVGYILGKPVNGFHVENGDVNHDGSVNISDVMGIVDIVLFHVSSSAPALATTDGIAAVSVPGGVDLHLDNASRYTALEMTVELPHGARLTRTSLCKFSTHQVMSHALGGGLHRVVVYSLSSEPLPEGDALLHLDIAGSGAVKVSDVLLANPFYESLAPQEATTIIDIAGESNDTPLYNLQGMKVKQPHKGVYVQDGKKMVVK